MNILKHMLYNLLLKNFCYEQRIKKEKKERKEEKKKKKLQEVQVKQVDGQELQINNDESG